MDNLVVRSMHAAPSPYMDRNEGVLHARVPHKFPEILRSIDQAHNGVVWGSVTIHRLGPHEIRPCSAPETARPTPPGSVPVS